MKKYKFALIFMLVLFSMPFVLSQQIATQAEISAAGITPERPFLYRMEMMWERIIENFSENAKLRHAQERIAEVKVMLQNNNLEGAEEVGVEFDRVRIELEMQDREQIQEHIELMSHVKAKIQEIGVGSQLTEQRRSEFRNMIQNREEAINQEQSQIQFKINQNRMVQSGR